MCIRPKGFLKGEHNVYFLVPKYRSVFILTKSEFISSCIRAAVGLNIVQITLNFFVNVLFLKKWPPVAILDVQKSVLTISDQYHNLYFCDFFYKMAAGGHFGCPKLTFDGISDHFRSIRNFFQNIFAKWPPAPILDVRNSLLNAFLAISDRYATLFYFKFLTK